MKNRKLIWICGMLLSLAILFGGCQTKAEKQYEEDMSAINTIVSQFNESEDMEEKLDGLKALIELQGTYENENADIESEFDLQISTMRKYFTDYYDNEISNNTYDYSATDEETLELLPDVINNLNDLLELIQSQGEVTCTNEELNQYEEDINNLIDRYESIIEEAEELKKSEEEAATTTEEVTEASTEAPVATTSAPSTEAPATEAPASNNSGQYYIANLDMYVPGPVSNLFSSGRSYQWTAFEDENGNLYDKEYFDNYGWVYDENGNSKGYNCYDY